MNEKISATIRRVRLDQQMTEQQFADKCGTTKAYILKAENDIGDVPISILQNIIEKGLGAKLRIAFEF